MANEIRKRAEAAANIISNRILKTSPGDRWDMIADVIEAELDIIAPTIGRDDIETANELRGKLAAIEIFAEAGIIKPSRAMTREDLEKAANAERHRTAVINLQNEAIAEVLTAVRAATRPPAPSKEDRERAEKYQNILNYFDKAAKDAKDALIAEYKQSDRLKALDTYIKDLREFVSCALAARDEELVAAAREVCDWDEDDAIAFDPEEAADLIPCDVEVGFSVFYKEARAKLAALVEGAERCK